MVNSKGEAQTPGAYVDGVLGGTAATETFARYDTPPSGLTLGSR